MKFASTLDYERYAQQMLDKPAFDHLNGGGHPAHFQSDFNHIKLKLRGMANLKYFKGINTKILGSEFSSPICLALPPENDIKMVLNVGVSP